MHQRTQSLVLSQIHLSGPDFTLAFDQPGTNSRNLNEIQVHIVKGPTKTGKECASRRRTARTRPSNVIPKTQNKKTQGRQGHGHQKARSNHHAFLDHEFRASVCKLMWPDVARCGPMWLPGFSPTIGAKLRQPILGPQRNTYRRSIFPSSP